MAQLDPRLANPLLLALAATRVQHRQRQFRPEPARPAPDDAWWAELAHLIATSPWRGAILAQLHAP